MRASQNFDPLIVGASMYTTIKCVLMNWSWAALSGNLALNLLKYHSI